MGFGVWGLGWEWMRFAFLGAWKDRATFSTGFERYRYGGGGYFTHIIIVTPAPKTLHLDPLGFVSEVISFG